MQYARFDGSTATPGRVAGRSAICAASVSSTTTVMRGSSRSGSVDSCCDSVTTTAQPLSLIMCSSRLAG